MKQRTFGTQVKAGAALLDVKYPGWEAKIDLSELDLGKGECCVLGQVYQGYGNGVKKVLGVDSSMGTSPVMEQLGFSLNGYSDSTMKAYKRLTQAWKRLIRKRRDTASPF